MTLKPHSFNNRRALGTSRALPDIARGICTLHAHSGRCFGDELEYSNDAGFSRKPLT